MDEKKGICVTCKYDKNCTFSRENPVWNCEEFKVDEVTGREVKVDNTNE